MTKMKPIINFLYEIGQLKQLPRTGWYLLGIENPESVAEHSFRAAVIGYILGVMEDADADKAMRICLMHDLTEARTGDLHKVAQTYIKKDFEDQIAQDQVSELFGKIKDALSKITEEFNADDSKEAIIAKDADYIEVSLTAKEYIEKGFKEAQNWIDNSKPLLKTESAKKMMEALDRSNPNEWWHSLKNIRR